MGYRFDFLDKSKAKLILPSLFSILHSNMSKIAPTGNTYAEDERIFLDSVAPALEKAPRQIVLMYNEAGLVGYFQYYVNGELFMMEEIQLKAECQHSGIFRDFYCWLLPLLPDGITRVEAYSHNKNTISQSILRHLGLEVIEETKTNFHFCGDFAKLYSHYLEKA